MIVLAMAAALAAPPQTQAQQDRLERVARHVVNAPFCETLGMTVDPQMPVQAEARLAAETGGWGVDPMIVRRLREGASQREGAMLRSDLSATTNGLDRDPQMKSVRPVFAKRARLCVAAAKDPIFAGLIVSPPGFDPEQAATAASDALLEAGGFASWQTPAIRTRGDLMMMAGMCRSRIGAARSDELRRLYGVSDDPRTRNYYATAFDEGLAEEGGTVAGCNRTIAATVAKLKAGR